MLQSCSVPKGDSHGRGDFWHVPPCIVLGKGGASQTPSLIGFCCLCLSFTWKGIVSINTSVFVASEQACKNQETPLLPLSLCWHYMQHLVIGTLTYRMVLKYKGEECWVILDTCNIPVCWAASGLLNSSLEDKVQSSASGSP